MRREEPIRAAALKLGAFAALSVAIVVTVAATIRPLDVGAATRGYTALFTSASRLRPGAQVMVSGIRVGRVTGVRLTSDNQAEVRFEVDRDVEVSRRTRVAIRYLDLVGNRYLALLDDGRDATAQPPQQPIGLGRTEPALDLNVLLNGFKPLFAALDPDDVNALATDIIRTFQGEGVTVRELVDRTASLTSTLAERDQLIGSVVDNLGATVGLVAARHAQLERLIRDVSRFASGLAQDRVAIGETLGHIDTMTALSEELLRQSRPALRDDLAGLRRIGGVLAEPGSRRTVAHALDHLPEKLSRMARTASYGSWFNYYVCSVKFRVDSSAPLDPFLRDLLDGLRLEDSAARCRP